MGRHMKKRTLRVSDSVLFSKCAYAVPDLGCRHAFFFFFCFFFCFFFFFLFVFFFFFVRLFVCLRKVSTTSQGTTKALARLGLYAQACLSL